MAKIETGTLGATFHACGHGSKEGDSIVFELTLDYADDTALSILVEGFYLPAVLLNGREVNANVVKQHGRLRPTDDKGDLTPADVKMVSVDDTITISRTHNRTVMFDLMRQGRTLFRCEMALDDFALIMTGMTRKVEFTVTRAIAKA